MEEDMQKIMGLLSNEEFVNKFKEVISTKQKSDGGGDAKKFFEAIIRQIPKPAIILFVNKNGIIEYINEYAAEIYGNSVAEMVGKRPSDLVKNKMAGGKTFVEMALEQKTRIEGVEAVLEFKGQQKPVIVSCAPVYTDGDFIGMTVVLIDITEQKRREEEARNALEFVKQMVLNMPGYVAFVGKEGLIKYANVNLAKLAGFEKVEDVIGKKPSEVAKIHPSYRDAARIFLNAIKNRQKLENLQMVLVTPKGEEIEVMADVFPVVVNGEFEGYVEIFREDIISRVPIPAFVIDSDHKVLYWNKACEMFTGVKAGDAVGTEKAWMAFYKEKRP
ncbi:MAG: methyl-accepting chemotaxis protein, partial [Archaeoglobaceae archaeon]|nr:methyl-accepting chemotaxis protein [Archaeoglobaceae archaeon]